MGILISETTREEREQLYSLMMEEEILSVSILRSVWL